MHWAHGAWARCGTVHRCGRKTDRHNAASTHPMPAQVVDDAGEHGVPALRHGQVLQGKLELRFQAEASCKKRIKPISIHSRSELKTAHDKTVPLDSKETKNEGSLLRRFRGITLKLCAFSRDRLEVLSVQIPRKLHENFALLQ